MKKFSFEQSVEARGCEKMKNSGWDREATREIVVSGLLGWTRKHDRREKDQLDFYRSAASTLSSRTRRKLTEKANWYKKSGSNDDDNNVTGDKNEHENTQKKRKRYDRTERPAKHEEKVTKNNDIKAVLNVPCTP